MWNLTNIFGDVIRILTFQTSRGGRDLPRREDYLAEPRYPARPPRRADNDDFA